MTRPALPLLLLALCTAHALGDKLTPKSAITTLNDFPEAVPSTKVLEAAARPVEIEAMTDKQEYRDGETIRLTVKSAAAGHARIYYRDAEGDVTVLFPLPAEKLAEAVRKRVPINDEVPAKKTVIISGKGSVTNISIVVGGPRHGREEIAVLVTDFPVKEDGAFIVQLGRSTSATDAARLTAGLAIRQDLVAKSARAELNTEGVPRELTAIGLVSIPINTRP